jgi:hypothetical protein
MSLPLYLVNHKAEMTVMRVQMFGWQGRNVAEDLCSFRTPFLQYIAFEKNKGWAFFRLVIEMLLFDTYHYFRTSHV